MSTRATIKITEQNRIIRLYHHSDGYPEGVGATLKSYLSNVRYWSMNDIANDLIKNNGIEDNGFEITVSIHGDENYLYWIDCDKKELHCYPIGWNEKEEDIINPNKEIIL